jgi:hypothetical protein
MPAIPNMTPPDPLLAEFVRIHRVNCPACQHSLQELRDNHCPRCNEDLMLDVAMADPCTRHLALGAIGLALGFGFNAFLGGILLVEQLRRGGGMVWLRILPLYVGALVLGVALLLWLSSRRRVRAWSRAARWSAVTGCWLLTIAFVTWLAINVILRVG